ncbi:MAG: TerB family tellurite resistance protein [Candidatus Zixiibacteriota bacterium]
MKRFLDVLFGADAKTDDASYDREYELRLATTALLVEMAGADFKYSSEERETIRDILSARFEMSRDDVDKIIEAAQQEIDKRLDLYRFTTLINEQFDKAEKIKIIEHVWRVIYSDGRLDGYEDRLVHRYTTLLKLDHKDMIDTKLKVKAELDL